MTDSEIMTFFLSMLLVFLGSTLLLNGILYKREGE